MTTATTTTSRTIVLNPNPDFPRTVRLSFSLFAYVLFYYISLDSSDQCLSNHQSFIYDLKSYVITFKLAARYE